MNEKSKEPIKRLAEAHEMMAVALREICELGITVPKAAFEAKEDADSISLEDVRGVLAEKSRQGHTATIKEILKSFGASKLSEVKEEDYKAVLDTVEGL